MSEEADPFLGLRPLSAGAAAEFRAAVLPLEKPGRAEAGDEDEWTRIVQAVDQCFHIGRFCTRWVVHRQGEGGIGMTNDE